MKFKLQFTIPAVLFAIILFTAFYSNPIYAKCSTDNFWATSGNVKTSVTPINNKEKNFTLRVEFTMTDAQIKASQCAGAYIEFDNELDGFSLPNQWDNYTANSNLPGWLHDLAVSDTTPIPGITRVKTADLRSNQAYFYELRWQDNGVKGSAPKVSLQWVPSHSVKDGRTAKQGWLTVIKERGAGIIGKTSGNDAWYIFDNGLRHYWSRDDMNRKWIEFANNGTNDFSFSYDSPKTSSESLKKLLQDTLQGSLFKKDNSSYVSLDLPTKSPTDNTKPATIQPNTQPELASSNPATTLPAPAMPTPSVTTIAPNSSTYAETSGTNGEKHTWTNYTNAGGQEGPSIPAGQTVQIACKTTGFKVANGNTWWYKIASGPWNGQYYVSADAFYNNGRTSGSLKGTPYVDFAVPNC